MKKIIVLFSVVVLASCSFNGDNTETIAPNGGESNNISPDEILTNSWEVVGGMVNDPYADRKQEFLQKVISLSPDANNTPLFTNYVKNRLYPYFIDNPFESKEEFNSLLSVYHDSLEKTQDKEDFYEFLLFLWNQVELELEVEDWIEKHGISPKNLPITDIVEFFYSQENPYYVWHPSSVKNGIYTYPQWVLEFLTFCEEYNKTPESIFEWYETNHLKEEYLSDYNAYKNGEVNANILKDKYNKRQAIHLSEDDFTEPSFIEPYSAIYTDEKLDCGKVITDFYNTVFWLSNIE